jgi:hypothetical protein
MESAPTFYYPLEINGEKYLICKQPNEPFSTLHDPDTKQMVGQWNNDEARYEITDHIAQFEMINNNRRNPKMFPATATATATTTATTTATATATATMTDQQWEQHMRGLIASGAAFTFVD